jgi:nucleoside 2-deoxyribosyltransferase/predicted ATPase
MPRLTGFAAYPSRTPSIGAAIRPAIHAIQSDPTAPSIESWEESDIAGRFIVTPILSRIDEGDLLVADITSLNFNVVFEIGYAIGRRKRVYLIRNEAIVGSDELIRQIGIFDTLGYQKYANSEQLSGILRNITDAEPLPLHETINTGAPVFLVLPRIKADVEVRLISRVKKARLMFRTFDPEEQGRMAAGEAIENVAQSYGVIIPLLANHRVDAEIHNFRAAFVAGLALALDRELLVLQDGEDPVPLDYRDLVSSYRSLEQIHDYVADFSSAIGARFQQSATPVVSEPKTFLERLNLGASAAENELQDLGHYYLQTDEYRRALRGEARVITGRKGAGKTALFSQLRDRLRGDRSRIVLDLKPEGFQLLKFKERLLDYLEEGTKEHTITAFWEYLLFLEICHKILEKDKQVHMRDDRLFPLYRQLADTYATDAFIAEGDFSERMIKLTERIADDFQMAHPKSADVKHLARGEITELLYRHDLAALRKLVVSYLEHKNGLWILFDNLDKGWPAHGISPEDVLTLRSLIEAMAKIERDLSRRSIECHGTVFIRNDVYELLVANTADRGKVARINLDWTDPELLREVLRRRFLYSGEGIRGDPSFEELWRQISITHIRGEESSEYLIDRSLMRPRALIELLRFCRSHAVNLGHQRIETADIEHGEENYSNQVLNNIDYEIGDVFPNSANVLWEFFGADEVMPGTAVRDLVIRGGGETNWESLLDLLLWYGFLGVIRENGDTAYIYSVSYEMRRLQALVRKAGLDATQFRVNPAFWRALEIQTLGSN